MDGAMMENLKTTTENIELGGIVLLGSTETNGVYNISTVLNNSTNGTIDGSPQPYLLTYSKVLFSVFYIVLIIVAVGGNAMVCYVVCLYPSMHTATNYFIVNLACSDILTAILCIPFTFISTALIHHWPFGSVMCPVVFTSQVAAVCLSAFTLVAISLDRFIAIIFPMRPRMTTKISLVIIALIWLFAIAVAMPSAIVAKIKHEEGKDYCREQWDYPQQQQSYSLAILVLQYFLPLFLLVFTYSWIGIVVWRKKAPGEAEDVRDQRMQAAKRRMIKMMIMVVIMYGCCWLPLHTITLIGEKSPGIWQIKNINVIYMVFHWIAMSNSCYNPMIYFWMNSKFRNGFRYAMRWCPFVKFDPDCDDMPGRGHVMSYVSHNKKAASNEKHNKKHKHQLERQSTTVSYCTPEHVPLRQFESNGNANEENA
ncbi:unnamed protein product [Owenia fusiformis]|nr:unnamed protein product [Owenia fusiformis]